MTNPNLSCDRLRIKGMTCHSCEVIIERRLKRIPGVAKVEVQHDTGECKIYSHPNTTLHLNDIRQNIADKGYTCELWSEDATSGTKKWRDLGVMLLIIFALYKILNAFGLFSLANSVDSSFSYGAVFVIGLVAATSTCIAVVGGLVLSVSSKYNEAHTSATRWQKFRPHLLFNLGRLISYFVLGGVIGLIGNAITPSPRFTGLLTVGISLVMILLGIDILKLFKTKKFMPRMPKWFSHKLHDLSEKDKPWVPMLLGGLTFFLPCGFTQSMQLYALTTGSFWKGALTMFVFALGTLPALLGVGMMSSFSKGKAASYFLKFSGALVLILGLYNLNNGLNLAGFSIQSAAASDPTAQVDVVGGKQVINMAVNGLKYAPASFTIQKGVPVEWHIDGSKAAGCARVITIPSMNITQYLSATEETVITFTPTSTGNLPFTCTMGMTSGRFTVVEGTTGTTVNADTNTQPVVTAPAAAVDPNAQTITMNINREQGFYPNEFTVKKGQPVNWIINDEVQLNGCMGTIVIPTYNLAKKLELGENSIAFTPTEAGTFPFTCSMGSKLGTITVE